MFGKKKKATAEYVVSQLTENQRMQIMKKAMSGKMTSEEAYATVLKDSKYSHLDRMHVANDKNWPSNVKKFAKLPERVILSDDVEKVNPHGKRQTRIIVITDKALYNCSESLQIKRRVLLDDIESITTSSSTTGFVLHIPKEYDYYYESPRRQQIILSITNINKAIVKEVSERNLTRRVRLKSQRRSSSLFTHISMSFSSSFSKLLKTSNPKTRSNSLSAPPSNGRCPSQAGDSKDQDWIGCVSTSYKWAMYRAKHNLETETLEFADKITKINSRSRKQTRLFAITTTALYNLSEAVEVKRRVPLTKITRMTCSSSSNEFVVHVPSEYDYWFTSKKRDVIMKAITKNAAHIKIGESPLSSLKTIVQKKSNVQDHSQSKSTFLFSGSDISPTDIKKANSQTPESQTPNKPQTQTQVSNPIDHPALTLTPAKSCTPSRNPSSSPGPSPSPSPSPSPDPTHTPTLGKSESKCKSGARSKSEPRSKSGSESKSKSKSKSKSMSKSPPKSGANVNVGRRKLSLQFPVSLFSYSNSSFNTWSFGGAKAGKRNTKNARKRASVSRGDRCKSASPAARGSRRWSLNIFGPFSPQTKKSFAVYIPSFDEKTELPPLPHLRQICTFNLLTDRRAKVRAELVETEQSYCRSLVQFLASYAYPLDVERNKSSLMGNRNKWIEIFDNFENIVRFHCDFFCPDLQHCVVADAKVEGIPDPHKWATGRNNHRSPRGPLRPTGDMEKTSELSSPSTQSNHLKSNESVQKQGQNTISAESLFGIDEKKQSKNIQHKQFKNTDIGKAFTKRAALLKTVYEPYLNNWTKLQEMIKKLMDKSKYQRFFKKQQDELKGMGVSSYLIMPIQRVPRYVLLIKELVKYTDNDHPEYDSLQKALRSIQKIAKVCDSYIR
ncbi:hypothetical protein AAMO2058_001545200 [Amorphochlora amoebiformis]